MAQHRAPARLYIVGGLLIIALIVFFPLVRNWPVLQWLTAPPGKVKAEAPNVTVWVETHTGVYFCPGSVEYEKIQPGIHLKQGEALQRGYRPAMHAPCTN